MSTLVTTHTSIRSTTGSALPFKKWAATQQLDVADKATRKLAMRRYDAERTQFYTDNRRVLGAAATDARFNIKKFQVVTDKDNRVIGFNAAARVPSKAELAAVAKANESSKDEMIKELMKRVEAAEKAAAAAIEAAAEAGK